MKPKKLATSTVKRAGSLRAKSSSKKKPTNLFQKIIQNSVSKLKNKPTAIVVISVLVLAGFFTFVYFKGSSTSALSAKTYNCQYDGTTTYREGSKGNCVKFVQAVVNGWMLCTNKTTRVPVDGIYGTKTSEGVVAFKNGNKNAILDAGGNLEPTVGKQAWGVMVKWSDANQKCMEDANLPPESPPVTASASNLELQKKVSCTYDGKTTYRSGYSDNCVKYIQAVINGWKQCNNKATTKISVNGAFDSATVAAVLEFKNANEKDILAARGTLEPTVGPQAWGVLLKYHELHQQCIKDANPKLFTVIEAPDGTNPGTTTTTSPDANTPTSTTTETNADYLILAKYNCTYDGKTTYREGDKGGCIKFVQAVINSWIECQNRQGKFDITGIFNNVTADRVLEFKKANEKAIKDAGGNLDPTVGPNAWTVLIDYAKNPNSTKCIDSVTGLNTTKDATTTTGSTSSSGNTSNNGTGANATNGSQTNNSSEGSDANSGIVSGTVNVVVGAANAVGGAVAGTATAVKDFFVAFFNKPFVKSTQKKYDCKYDGKTTYKLGDEASCVKYIQTIINAEKYCSGRGDYVIRTGKFDRATESAVVDFKQARSKDIKKAKADFDGQVGPQAWKVLVKYNATHKKCTNEAINTLGVVQTTEQSSSTSTSSGSDSNPNTNTGSDDNSIDLCPNLPGTQSTIPAGYYQAQSSQGVTCFTNPPVSVGAHKYCSEYFTNNSNSECRTWGYKCPVGYTYSSSLGKCYINEAFNGA